MILLIDFGRQNDRPEAPKMEPESIQKALKNLSKHKTEKVGSSGAESGRRGGGGGGLVKTRGGGLFLKKINPNKPKHPEPPQKTTNN